MAVVLKDRAQSARGRNAVPSAPTVPAKGCQETRPPRLRSLSTLRGGGLLIVVPGDVPHAVAAAAREQRKRATGMLVEPDYPGLEALAALYEEGRLRVEVAEAIPFADARRAHELSEAGGLRGKLVLIPDSA